MSDAANSNLRAQMLDWLVKQINAKYGPQTSNNWFRGVRRGPWRPGNSVRPYVTLTDGGQTRADVEDGSSANRTLKYTLSIDLAVNWDREDQADDWSARIEELTLWLENLAPPYGVQTHKIMADEPLEVLFGQGQTESVWIIEGEIERFADVGEMGET